MDSRQQLCETPFQIRAYDLLFDCRNVGTTKLLGNRLVLLWKWTMEKWDGGGIFAFQSHDKLKSTSKEGTMIRSANNKSCQIYFKYKRLLTFCYTCGCYGHSMKDCERESEDEEDNKHGLVYEDQIRASPLKKTMEVDFGGYGSTRWKIFNERNMAESVNIHHESGNRN